MIKLPKGYKAVKDRYVGISYEDDKGNIVFQYPKDTDYARRMLYCQCTEPTSHSSGTMEDGSSLIICQSCRKEMFIKAIHSVIGKEDNMTDMNYSIRSLKREQKYHIERLSRLREIIVGDTCRMEENKKEIEKIEKELEEMDADIRTLEYQIQAKEDNAQKE
ncbi:MAG: hypothetical protein AAB875_05175 [Patescibacteria group bacterium]|mgnify:CR=1 FL=1